MPGPAPFVVIRARREERDPVALARALAAVRGTPVQDQVIAARGAWGIVGEGLSQEQARDLALALRSRGIECAVGPASGLARLPEIETARSGHDLPSAAPALLAAAAVTVTETTKTRVSRGPSSARKVAGAAVMLATGLPVGAGGRKRTVEKSGTTETRLFFADLVYPDARRRLRIAAGDFDFSCLGARMLYHAQGNLRLLLGDLAAAAPEAWRNHGAQVLLEGRPLRTMGYDSLEDLEREERWLLTLRRIGEAS